MLINPSGLVDFLNSGSHPDGFFTGISKGIATAAGITAMWAHMVAGDICVTRWIWKDGIRKKNQHLDFKNFFIFWCNVNASWSFNSRVI